MTNQTRRYTDIEPLPRPPMWKLIGFYILLFSSGTLSLTLSSIHLGKLGLFCALAGFSSFCVAFFGGRGLGESAIWGFLVFIAWWNLFYGPLGLEYLLNMK